MVNISRIMFDSCVTSYEPTELFFKNETDSVSKDVLSYSFMDLTPFTANFMDSLSKCHRLLYFGNPKLPKSEDPDQTAMEPSDQGSYC